MHWRSMVTVLPLACAWLLTGAPAVSALAGDTATDWDVDHRSKARLVIGAVPEANGGARLLAGLEIELAPHWKTYWRQPGDAGGVPPNFDWAGSANLGRAEVAFPAPGRFRDDTGTTIGYKDRVVLPITIVPADPARAVELKVRVEYGVCKEICIPARGKFSIAIDPARVGSLPPALAGALAAVPKPGGGDGLPALASVELEPGTDAALMFKISYPHGVEGTDLFVEAPGDLFLPPTKRVGELPGGIVRYAIRLPKGTNLAKLRSAPLRLTMTSPAGSAEVRASLASAAPR